MSSSTALMIEDMVEKEEGVDEQESHAGADQVDMGTSSSRKGFPSVSTDDEITARGVPSMVESKKMEGPRVDGDSFLIKLDKEIVGLRSKAEWLAKKLKATKRIIKQVEERSAGHVASPPPNSEDSE
ncbi:hypothetical protein ACSBR2_011736 [Camellia fascicularis]